MIIGKKKYKSRLKKDQGLLWELRYKYVTYYISKNDVI